MTVVQYRIFEVVCDNCGATWTGSANQDRSAVLDLASLEGWAVRGLGYLGNRIMFADVCGDCSNVTDQKLRQKRLKERNRGNNEIRNQ